VLATYPAVLEADSAVFGIAGALLVAGAVVRPAAALVPWGVSLLGAAYALALVVSDRDLDVAAGFVAAGLLLVGELAYWSVEARDWPREDSSAARVRLAGLLLLALAGATIGTLLVAAGAAVPADLGLVQVAGALGAVGALVALALLARR
jgi:hypothetical protein